MRSFLVLIVIFSTSLFGEEAPDKGVPKFEDMTSSDLMYLLDNSSDWHKNVEILSYMLTEMSNPDSKVGNELRTKEHADSILANALFTKSQYQGDASYGKDYRHKDLTALESRIKDLRKFSPGADPRPKQPITKIPKGGATAMDLKGEDSAIAAKITQTLRVANQCLIDGQIDGLMAKCFMPYDDQEVARRRDQVIEDKGTIQKYLQMVLENPEKADWTKEKTNVFLYKIKSKKDADSAPEKSASVELSLLEYQGSVLLVGVGVVPRGK
jgi:hypothetical protein